MNETPLGHARRWIWRIGQRGQFASVPLAGGCTATDIVMGKDGKRDERKARRARKAEKQMNRRLHEKEAGQRKQSKRRKHSTASSAVLEISFRSQWCAVWVCAVRAAACGSNPFGAGGIGHVYHLPCHGARHLRHQELDPLSCTTTHGANWRTDHRRTVSRTPAAGMRDVPQRGAYTLRCT